jgi:DNA-directed RNA polymerase specialized sigma24 family protein
MGRSSPFPSSGNFIRYGKLMPQRANNANFTATRWSMVQAAARPDDAHRGLTWLCERYWFPLFAYARGRGLSPEDAEDTVQTFFADMLEQNLVARADAERGRFRSFLLGCLNNYMARERERGQTIKRGGGTVAVSLDDKEARLQRELISSRTPALDFDRAWALTMLDRVLAALGAECEADGKEGRFEVFQCFLQGERADLSMAEAAGRLGISAGAVRSFVHRLRLRFRAMLSTEIRETVSSDAEVPGELQHLLAALL